MGPPGKVCYFGGRMAETCEQQIDRVQEAIAAIEARTVARYTIGNHSLTKHNPQTLYNREERLLRRIANSGDAGRRVAQVSGGAGNPGRSGPVGRWTRSWGCLRPGWRCVGSGPVWPLRRPSSATTQSLQRDFLRDARDYRDAGDAELTETPLSTLRNICRDMGRNNPPVKGLLLTEANDVVGTQTTIQARSSNEAWNARPRSCSRKR